MAKNKSVNQSCLAALAVIVAFGLTGCHGNQSNEQSTQNQDPAQVNQAPASDQTESANQTAASTENAPSTEPTPEATPAPQQSQPESSNYPSGNSYPQYSENQTVEEAPQPPPALPQYDQPPCPDPNYIWTPGHWAWSPEGYYWVPGAWVAAPYEGALWTPGYWGYRGAVYVWHPGYWGPHIGFYGGINYGFGYVGVGFLGGFWSRNGFHYNRSVTNVNTTTITNVYNYRVTNNVIINNTRVSYNGGSGGVSYQPSRAELAASRESHIRALPAQVEVIRAAAANRAQFVSVNRGRPQQMALATPVAAERISPPAGAVNPGVHGAVRPEPAAKSLIEARPPIEARPETPSSRPAAPAFRPAAPASRPAEHATRPAPPEHRTVPPSNPNRTELRREVPAARPVPPAAERPTTRSSEQHAMPGHQVPPEPHEIQAHKAPPRQPTHGETKQGHRPEEHPPQ